MTKCGLGAINFWLKWAVGPTGSATEAKTHCGAWDLKVSRELGVVLWKYKIPAAIRIAVSGNCHF